MPVFAPDEPNPYAAPQASLGPPSDGADAPARQSRWALLRFIPVVYLGLFTLNLPIGAVVGVVMIGWIVWHATDPAVFLSRRFADLVLLVLTYTGMAPLAYWTMRAWYRCRWRRAIVFSTGFVVLVALGGLISKLR